MDEGSMFSVAPFVARISRVDFMVIYTTLLILGILFIVGVFLGEGTAWFQSLKHAEVNPWIIRVLWIIGTILSYIAFFFIWQDVRIHPIPKDEIVSVLYIISGFLFVAWVAVLYYGQNLTATLWISVIILLYNLWLFFYVWYLNPIAAVFLILNLVLYVYLVYYVINLADINDIPI